MHVYLFIYLCISRVKKLYRAYVYCFCTTDFLNKIYLTWLLTNERNETNELCSIEVQYSIVLLFEW